MTMCVTDVDSIALISACTAINCKYWQTVAF